MHRFSICALLYGGQEYAWLHDRCLTSFMSVLPRENAEIRIGMNEVTADSTHVLVEKLTEHFGNVQIFAGGNIGKYPRMSHMFSTIDRPYMMWFDDDSFLKPELIGQGQAWLDKIVQLQEKTPGILGATYNQHWTGRHRRWVMSHPLYKGVPLHPTHEQFITGGWWVAPMQTLRMLAWPNMDLYHNGGDRMLGWVARQNRVPLLRFFEGVAINADASGAESTAPRRGLNTKGLGD